MNISRIFLNKVLQSSLHLLSASLPPCRSDPSLFHSWALRGKDARIAHPQPSKVVNGQQKPCKKICTFFSCLAHAVQPGLGFCRESKQEEERVGLAGRKTGSEAIPPPQASVTSCCHVIPSPLFTGPPKAPMVSSPLSGRGTVQEGGCWGQCCFPFTRQQCSVTI